MAVSDNNKVPKIIKALEELNSKKLEVGIFAPEGSELYMIAIVNEYGVDITVTDKMRAYLHYRGLHLKATTTEIHIPERSFIRAGYDSMLSDLEKLIEKGLPSVVTLKTTPDDFLGIIGEYCVGKLHEYVQAKTTPPNHPFTIQEKGSSHPLINTGRLNQSITYRVVDK